MYWGLFLGHLLNRAPTTGMTRHPSVQLVSGHQCVSTTYHGSINVRGIRMDGGGGRWWRCPVHPVQSIDVQHSWTDLLFRASACSTYPGVCMMYRAHLYGSGRHYFTGSILVVASIPPSQALLHRLSWYSTWLQFHWVVFLRYPHRLIHPTHDRLVKQCAFIQSDPHQRAIGPVHPMIPS
jgi:hypothetical protein